MNLFPIPQEWVKSQKLKCEICHSKKNLYTHPKCCFWPLFASYFRSPPKEQLALHGYHLSCLKKWRQKRKEKTVHCLFDLAPLAFPLPASLSGFHLKKIHHIFHRLQIDLLGLFSRSVIGEMLALHALTNRLSVSKTTQNALFYSVFLFSLSGFSKAIYSMHESPLPLSNLNVIHALLGLTPLFSTSNPPFSDFLIESIQALFLTTLANQILGTASYMLEQKGPRWIKKIAAKLNQDYRDPL